MKNAHLTLTAGTLIFALLLMMACSSDEHGEARALMVDQAKVTEAYINDLEKAQDAGDVADAINNYTESLKEMMPRIKAFRENYPSYTAWARGGEVPKELEQEIERLNMATEKLKTATMNMMKYMMSPEVQEAVANMGRELGALNQ